MLFRSQEDLSGGLAHPGQTRGGSPEPRELEAGQGALFCSAQCPIVPFWGGGTMQRRPGEAEDKGPFVAPSPPERQRPGPTWQQRRPPRPRPLRCSHCSERSVRTQGCSGRLAPGALDSPSLPPDGCVGSWPTAGGDKEGWEKCGMWVPVEGPGSKA